MKRAVCRAVHSLVWSVKPHTSTKTKPATETCSKMMALLDMRRSEMAGGMMPLINADVLLLSRSCCRW